MRDAFFDPWELLLDLKRRWPVIAVSCVSAFLIALGISMMLPKRYTATAGVLIQAPGGNDPRAATAINPVYLESLKVYERMASSDSLFARALAHVHASGNATGPSTEAARKRILRVSKLANTAMLEISATMTDPVKAQALAQYVAEQTVQARLAIDAQTEIEMTSELRSQREAAAERLAKGRHAQADLRGSEPLDALENQMGNNTELALNVEKEQSQVRTELAGYMAEEQASPTTAGSDAAGVKRLIASARARIADLESQRRDLDSQLKDEGARVQEWKNRQESLAADQKAAQLAFDTATARLNEVVTSARFRGERLLMTDPGIVPQQPSSPNVPLNLAAAVLLGAIGSLSYLVMTFSYQRAAAVKTSARTLPAYSLRG